MTQNALTKQYVWLGACMTMQVDRLFSNIEQDPSSKTFGRRHTSLLGATALVGGTTVSRRNSSFQVFASS
jgi:hypothetical protein